jgi:hypothetical protein
VGAEGQCRGGGGGPIRWEAAVPDVGVGANEELFEGALLARGRWVEGESRDVVGVLEKGCGLGKAPRGDPGRWGGGGVWRRPGRGGPRLGDGWATGRSSFLTEYWGVVEKLGERRSAITLGSGVGGGRRGARAVGVGGVENGTLGLAAGGGGDVRRAGPWLVAGSGQFGCRHW